VRPVGETSGPPLAALRLPATATSIPFRISSADSMMGQALPPHLTVEARFDGDGNLSTRDPADPVALVNDVALGTQDVQLRLAQPAPKAP
jgi:hypothetical protein